MQFYSGSGRLMRGRADARIWRRLPDGWLKRLTKTGGKDASFQARPAAARGIDTCRPAVAVQAIRGRNAAFRPAASGANLIGPGRNPVPGHPLRADKGV
ncbi:hypothetical protein, partial [Rhodovulum visakhapatnamense]|uniref:hypothetical protein n=1 Tax=Rhodovulum visakhapatnamense TaxID=364297 RepID=UPI001F3DC827